MTTCSSEMVMKDRIGARVADPEPVGSGPFFGRILIRKIFTGSYQYLGNVKLYKQGKNI